MKNHERATNLALADPCMGFNYQDAKRLWSSIRCKEEQMNSKRSWLIRPPATSGAIGKRFKKPKFLKNLFLLESNVRSDDVSSETVKNHVERSFGTHDCHQGSHHVVQDYLQYFKGEKMESYAVNPLHFLRTFYGILDDLNNKALCLIADMVTANKVRFNKTRPEMKRIIKDYLVEVFAESNPKDWLNLLNKLSQIFRHPSNFRDKKLTLLTPVSSVLLSSIHKTLEGIDKMPLQTLIAVNRELKGETHRSKPPSILLAHKILRGYKSVVLVDRIRKRSTGVISKLKKGVDLPKQLARALSVMRLSLKYETGCTDLVVSEFFPFPSEVVALQNDILRALWSLPKVKTDELKVLQSFLDPESKICIKTFRSALRKYLIEYLFRCGEIEIPDEVLKVLAVINRRQRRARACSKEIREEVESTLNVSSQLKNILLDLLLDNTTEEVSAKGFVDDFNENNDFILSENGYCSNPDDWMTQHLRGSRSSYEAETSGDSRPFISSTERSSYEAETSGDLRPFISSTEMPANNITSVLLSSATRDFIPEVPKPEYTADANLYTCPIESKESLQLNALQGVDEICDEASLFVHGLIGHFLDRILQAEGRKLDPISRSYLRGKASPLVDFQGAENSLNTSKEDTRSQILIQVAEQLLPSLPQSCIEAVKEIMQPP